MRFKLGACILLLLVQASILTEIWEYGHNTLLHNGAWQSIKASLYRGSNAAVTFMITRQGLSQNTLNLGAWLGFQELRYKQHCPLKSWNSIF